MIMCWPFKSVVAGCAATLLAAAVGAAELKNGAEFAMNDVPEELTVHLKRGGSVRFLLEENGTTGYQWEATYAKNECTVAIEHRGADTSNGLCGAPGKAAFTVTKSAAVQSPSLVEFAYRRSWEKDRPAKTVRLVLYTIPGEQVDFRYPASRTLHMLKAECANRGIELIDWHVHIRGGLTPEMAAAREKACGFRQSAMENHGREWEIFDNARLLSFAENVRKAKVNGHSLPVGIQVNDRDWFRQIDAKTRAHFDYILADTMIMGKLPNGRDKRLWLVRDISEIGDPEAWMDEYVKMNLQILGEPISILANPGYLPAPLDGLHDSLWTEARMRQVIGKAVERGIAIEIQAESPYPSPKFLRLAKEMGAKFSFGTNNYDAAPKDLSRWLEAIVWLDLHGSDIWTPRCLKTADAVEKPAPDAADLVPLAYRRLWNENVQRGIDERIEKWRKADAKVAGLPPGAEVRVEQIGHDFQFGSHIFNFDQLGRDDWNALYRATFTNLWNAATVSFYWDRMETEEGKIRSAAGPRDSAEFWKSVKDMSTRDKWEKFAEYRRPAPDPVLDFLDANGVSAHGHPMIYPVFVAPWVTNGVDRAGLAARYERRIRQLGAHYGARVDQWDVVNETVDRSCSMAGPFHDKVVWRRPNHLVPDDYTFRCHRWAAEAFPAGVKLEINDSWRPIYVPFVQSLIDRGAKIDVVGLQMHIFAADQARQIAAGEPCLANGTDWTPKAQFQMLWALDTLKRPIHISEITIPAPDDTAAGEEIQARMMRDNYRLWFSWPSVYRITYWNLVDHTYHKENLASGLYTADMRRKKAYYALDRLINHEWKTRLTVKADADGNLAFRGFKGKYRLIWKDASGRSAVREISVK